MSNLFEQVREKDLRRLHELREVIDSPLDPGCMFIAAEVGPGREHEESDEPCCGQKPAVNIARCGCGCGYLSQLCLEHANLHREHPEYGELVPINWVLGVLLAPETIIDGHETEQVQQ